MERYIQTVLLSLFVLLSLSSLAHAKVVEGKAELSKEQPWANIAKFAYGIGLGWFRSSMTLTKGTSLSGNKRHLTLCLYLDEEWSKALETPDCEQRVGLARGQLDLEYDTLLVPNEAKQSHTIKQKLRPHIWYVALADCNLTRSDSLSPAEVEYSIIMTNGSDDHFDWAESGFLELYAVMSCLFTVCVAWFLYKLILHRSTHGTVEPVIHILSVVQLVQFLAVIFKFYHLMVYSRNGVGVPQLDLLREYMVWLAQLFLSLLFVALAWGWTITTSTLPHTKKRYVIALVLFHMMLVWQASKRDINVHKYHDWDCWEGYLLVGLRLLLYLFFVVGLRNVLLIQTSGPKRQFLVVFSLYTSGWFLAWPMTFVIAPIFAEYLRHKVVTVTYIVVQFLALVALSNLFLTRGQFYRITTLSSSLLPRMGSFDCKDQ